ncbi:MAG: DUF5320 domain-containing protein [Candidatus Syntropharchaeia archaeon]
MPFGMGPLGWFFLPYLMGGWYPYFWGYPWRYSSYPSWGYLWWYYPPVFQYPFPPMTKEQEVQMLEAQLEEIKKRMEELKK